MLSCDSYYIQIHGNHKLLHVDILTLQCHLLVEGALCVWWRLRGREDKSHLPAACSVRFFQFVFSRPSCFSHPFASCKSDWQVTDSVCHHWKLCYIVSACSTNRSRAHTYDVLIRMTCSYVWHAHTYDVLIRMTCSYVWRAHTYDVLIHMTCSYVRRNKMTGSIGACVRQWRFSKANNLTSMQNFSDVQQISCTWHNYLYDDVEKHEIPRMELDMCSFEIFWKYPLTCSRLFLRSGEILVPSRSGDRPSCCSTSITSSTSPRCGRDNSSRWRHSSSYRKYTNLAPCIQNEANWNRQWNEMWSTRTVSTTVCSTGPPTVTDGSVTYTTPNDRSIQLDAILFNLGSIQP